MRWCGRYETTRSTSDVVAVSNWIYESPDGGKTLYRRPFGGTQPRERLILLDDATWCDSITAAECVMNVRRESYLREKYPAVLEAWEHYQTMINLVDGT